MLAPAFAPPDSMPIEGRSSTLPESLFHQSLHRGLFSADSRRVIADPVMVSPTSPRRSLDRDAGVGWDPPHSGEMIQGLQSSTGVPSGGSFWQSHSAAASAKVGSFGARSAAGNGGVLSSMVRRNEIRSVTAVGSLSRMFATPPVPARQCASQRRAGSSGSVPMPNASSRVCGLRRRGSTARCRRCRAASGR